MVLVCLHVSAKGRPVIPWTIVSVNESISFVQLFENLRAGSISTFEQYAQNLQQCHLTQCSVAKSRDGPFNIVDKCLQLDDVCSIFGSYVKLLCDTQDFEPATLTTQTTTRNAFAVLMQSQAALSQADQLP